MSFVSYAQNFEDVLLHRVFGGQETGFYVDVGAYHPVDGSVTKAFYDLGWSGINLEPELCSTCSRPPGHGMSTCAWRRSTVRGKSPS